MNVPPISEATDVYVRAYTPPPPPDDDPAAGVGRVARPSEWALVFDIETTTDASQRLRFGTSQTYQGHKLRGEAIFYDPDELTDDDLALLRQTARKRRRCQVMTVTDWIHSEFYNIAVQRRGRVVGFNLPFDISRLAIGHSTARYRRPHDPTGGGFSFLISEHPGMPRIRIKRTTQTSSMIEFTQPDGRPPHARGTGGTTHRGFFVDVATVAAALYGGRRSLAAVCELLDTPTKKQPTDAHGEALTADYIRYALDDTQATWECYAALKDQWRRSGLETHGATPLHRLHSEATVAKATLRALGVAPQQSQLADPIIAAAMEAYYGGRTETRIRRHAVPVQVVDFASQYPTVMALQHLWPYIAATHIECLTPDLDDITRLIDNTDPDDLLQPDIWPYLNVLVNIDPDGDRLLSRPGFSGDSGYWFPTPVGAVCWAA